MRSRVVICDRHKVQAAGRGCLDGQKSRARDRLAALAGTAPIAVSGMQVEVATVPPCLPFERLLSKPHQVCIVLPEIDLCFKRRHALRTNVGNADQEAPSSSDNGTGKIRRCCICCTECKSVFVSAAPTTNTLRIRDSHVQSSVFILAGVFKSDSQ